MQRTVLVMRRAKVAHQRRLLRGEPLEKGLRQPGFADAKLFLPTSRKNTV